MTIRQMEVSGQRGYTYASIGAASGESLYIVGKLVGHKQHATTQRYAHLADDPLREAADRISSQISSDLTARTGCRSSGHTPVVGGAGLSGSPSRPVYAGSDRDRGR